MRIGLCGNLANNAYVYAKALRQAGYNAEVILDTNDTFAMSQPVWEDGDFCLETNTLMNNKLTYNDWQKKIKEIGWQKPDWIKEIKGNDSYFKRFITIIKSPIRYFRIFLKYDFIGSFIISGIEPIIKKMREYDIILAFGLMPICAYFSKKPYIAFCYGSDLAIIPFQEDTLLQRGLALLQKIAYRNAEYLASSNESRSRNAIKKLGLGNKWFLCSALIDTNNYRLESVQLEDILDDDIVNKARNKFIFFVPSRQDFYWKGSNGLLRAYAKLVEEKKENVFMILAGWGMDLDKSRQLANELGIEDNLYFLPYALSKKMLIKFFNATDVVLDQFNLGGLGGLVFEAMACGKPVIVNFQKDNYLFYYEILPPVLHAENEAEIFNQMLKVINNKSYCKKMGKKAREWVIENCSFDKNSRLMEKIINLCKETSSPK